MSRRRPRSLLAIVAVGYAFLHLPVLILVVFSFNESRFAARLTGFTWEWYAAIADSPQILDALKVSLIVALAATAISTVIGTLVALALARHRFRGRAPVESLLYLPMVTPEVVVGISLLAFFVLLRFPLGISSIVVAHVAFCISFVAVVVLARLHGIDRNLEEAAMDLGADELTTFWKVTLPLLRPGIVAAALLAFTLSFDDFVITFFVAGVGATTLPLLVFSMVKLGVAPTVNAISAIFLLVSTAAVLLADRALGRRSGGAGLGG
jgi:spermidine/putrescine transport system permease protein